MGRLWGPVVDTDDRREAAPSRGFGVDEPSRGLVLLSFLDVLPSGERLAGLLP